MKAITCCLATHPYMLNYEGKQRNDNHVSQNSCYFRGQREE